MTVKCPPSRKDFLPPSDLGSGGCKKNDRPSPTLLAHSKDNCQEKNDG